MGHAKKVNWGDIVTCLSVKGEGGRGAGLPEAGLGCFRHWA